MNYCTVADLADNVSERVLIQLSDDSTPPTVVNQDRCLAVIADASEIIDGRLRSRYSGVPLSEPIPALIRSICVDIAVYKLYSRRNQGDIENIRARYKDALDNLDRIRLSEQSPAIANSFAEYKCSKRLSDRVFTSEVLERY